MARKPTMAMSSDFLRAYAQLPRAQQKGVRSLISKFNLDSTAGGLRYKPIQGVRDPDLRSLRVDDGYRAIVLKPDQGDVHVLLWAGKRRDAYAWAARRECRINAETGALQVYVPQVYTSDEAGVPTGVTRRDSHHRPAPFESLSERKLLRLGVPAAMLNEIRTVRDDAELDAMQARLPTDAYNALFLFLAGDTYEKLVNERQMAREPVDTADFGEALRRDGSRARFVVVDNDGNIEETLERWRVVLRPSQYDAFWTSQVGRMRGALQEAAEGKAVRINVADLRQYGRRRDWSGRVRVRDGEILPPAGMAHARSLGKVLLKHGIPANWPKKVFHLSIDRNGDWLTARSV